MFVVGSEDEMILDVDFSVVTVEVWPLLVSVDTIVENIDGYIEVMTVVIGWTDDVSKIDVIISEIDDDVVV